MNAGKSLSASGLGISLEKRVPECGPQDARPWTGWSRRSLIGRDGAARFAFGAVAPTPFVAADNSGALVVNGTDASARAAALRGLFASARPITDVRGSQEYRRAMLEVMTERTWQAAADRLRRRLETGSA